MTHLYSVMVGEQSIEVDMDSLLDGERALIQLIRLHGVSLIRQGFDLAPINQLIGEVSLITQSAIADMEEADEAESDSDELEF